MRLASGRPRDARLRRRGGPQHCRPSSRGLPVAEDRLRAGPSCGGLLPSVRILSLGHKRKPPIRRGVEGAREARVLRMTG